MRRLIPLLTLALAALALTGCKKQPSASSNEIVIGEYGSMSGSEATFGQSTNAGIQMAVDEQNAAGGILGKQIHLIVEDDQGQQDQAIAAVKKLVDSDGAVAILGEVSSKLSMAGGGICEQEGVPMISPSSTNPDVTKGKKYLFRVCFTDDFQGAVDADFGIQQGWKHVAALTCSDQDYSLKLSEFFKQRFTQKGGQIAIEETYQNDAQDFSAQLTRIAQTSPDAVYLPGYYTAIGKILKQARDQGIKVPFFGGDGWDGVPLNDLTDGCYFTDHYFVGDPNPGVQAFVKAFRAAHNGADPDSFAITGYDAAKVLFDSIRRAGKVDRDAVRDAIEQTQNFPGAGGSITIDAEHNTKKPIVVLQIHDEKMRLVQTVQPQ